MAVLKVTLPFPMTQSRAQSQNPFSAAAAAASQYSEFVCGIRHILRLNSAQSISRMFDGIPFREYRLGPLHFDGECDRELNAGYQCH